MKFIIVMAIAFGLITGRAEAAAPTFSKPESRGLPATTVTHMVTDQLAEILLPPAPFKGRKPPTQPLRHITYFTRPISTHNPVLCQTHQITFRFEPAAEERGADTQVEMSDVETTPFFYFLKPPSEPNPDYLMGEDYKVANLQCAVIDPWNERLIQAQSSDDANDGALVFLNMRAKLDALSIQCDDVKIDCKAFVAKLELGGLDDIEACDEDPGQHCWNLRFGLTELHIYVDDRLIPQRVTESELVITGDYIRD